MLLDNNSIVEVAVVGVPSAKYGQTICAIVVPRAGEPQVRIYHSSKESYERYMT